VQNYHEALGVVPPSLLYKDAALPTTIAQDDLCTSRLTALGSSYVVDGNKHGFSWTSLILPYAEMNEVYDQIGVATLTSAQFIASTSRLAAVTKRRYSSFHCSSDSCPPQNPDVWYAANGYVGVFATNDGNMPTTNYVGNHASHSYWPNGTTGCDASAFNGVFGVQARLRFKDVTDGLSKTILIGERSSDGNVGLISNGPRNPAAGKAGGGILFLGHGIRASYGWPRYSVGFGGINLVNTGANQDISGTTGLAIASSYSSMHRGGAGFAMCDGSVSFISDNIEWINADNGSLSTRPSGSVNSVLESLQARNDGGVFAAP
jgi:prepilin-type processing-associated H-X9-DG protein